MSWLRIDDGFTKHPKFEGWTLPQKWAWLEVMEYCARYETRGRIPTDLTIMPRTTTPALLALAATAGWCDRGPDGAFWIHDWDEFNPPRYDDGELDQRVAEAIAEHPDASANDIVRIIGGKRKPTLEAIRRFRTGSRSGSPAGSREPGEGGSGNHEGTGSRARPRATRAPASARVPVPSPESDLKRSLSKGSSAPADAGAAPNGKRPASQLASERIRNIGAELPLSALTAELEDALGDRYTELTADDLVELRDLHAALAGGADA